MQTIAGIVFNEGTRIDAEIFDAIAEMRRRGLRVSGVVQTRAAAEDGGDLVLADIETGKQLPILSELGPLSEGCRLDPQAIADIAGRMQETVDGRPDVFVINRVGKAEEAGGGLRQLIERAVVAGVPLLVAVRYDYADAWSDFHGGMAAELPPRSDAIVAWAMGVREDRAAHA